MSGTDAAGTAQIVTNLDVETRKEITALRKLFLNPGEVHLFTRDVWHNEAKTAGHEDRWLSDRYVMINVTDSYVLDVPEFSDVWPADGSKQWPDGLYKLSAGKGLQPGKPGLVCPDTNGLLDRIETCTNTWYELHRTPWSMADDEARKMLVYANVPPAPPMQGDWHAEPFAINEGIWDQLSDYVGTDDDEISFEYAHGRPYRLRFYDRTVAYVATANFPQAMRPMALRLLGVDHV